MADFEDRRERGKERREGYESTKGTQTISGAAQSGASAALAVAEGGMTVSRKIAIAMGVAVLVAAGGLYYYKGSKWALGVVLGGIGAFVFVKVGRYVGNKVTGVVDEV